MVRIAVVSAAGSINSLAMRLHRAHPSMLWSRLTASQTVTRTDNETAESFQIGNQHVPTLMKGWCQLKGRYTNWLLCGIALIAVTALLVAGAPGLVSAKTSPARPANHGVTLPESNVYLPNPTVAAEVAICSNHSEQPVIRPSMDHLTRDTQRGSNPALQLTPAHTLLEPMYSTV